MGIQEGAGPEWGHPVGPMCSIGQFRPSPDSRKGDRAAETARLLNKICRSWAFAMPFPGGRIALCKTGFRCREPMERRVPCVKDLFTGPSRTCGAGKARRGYGCCDGPVLTDPRRLWRWRLRRALVAEVFAEARGGRVNQVARPKVAHVRSYGANAVRNERQECGRARWIEGRDLGVVSRRDEEAEPKGESEDDLADETNVLHARAFPGYPRGVPGVRTAIGCRTERPDVNRNLLALMRRTMNTPPGYGFGFCSR
jgi:hypothetical protein